jgi:acetoacetate decarboxylase
MRLEEVIHHATTPLINPPYFLHRARFYDREYLNIFYRSDPDTLRRVVPEPLEPTEPIVRFEFMRMGDVAGYGPYTECGQAIPVTYGGVEGEYLHAMYLDNFGATVAGRGLGAYPKVPGSPKLHIEGGALLGTLDYVNERVATASMAYKWEPMDPAEALDQIRTPQYGLKIVADRSGGYHAFDLMRTQITDVAVKESWKGPARLQLLQHVMAPVADLPVLEVVSSSHILTDLTLAGFDSVFSYLDVINASRS